MAFATTNLVRENQGTQNVVRGTWTATAGDAAGTFQVGSIAVDAEFRDNLSTGPYQPRVPVSGLGGATVTVYHQGTVTAGTFRVVFK